LVAGGAAVNLPTASHLSVMARVCSDWCDISAMPPALSAMGPNTSMASTYAAEDSAPIVATAVPYSPPTGSFETGSVSPEACPIQYAKRMAVPTTAHAGPVEFKPTASPAMMFVAWPISDAPVRPRARRFAGAGTRALTNNGLHRLVRHVGVVLGQRDARVAGRAAHQRAQEEVPPSVRGRLVDKS
jgi:hypothetical protein